MNFKNIRLYGELPANTQKKQLEKLDTLLQEFFKARNLFYRTPTGATEAYGDPLQNGSRVYNASTDHTYAGERFQIRYQCSKEFGVDVICTAESISSTIQNFMDELQTCANLLIEYVFPGSFLCYDDAKEKDFLDAFMPVAKTILPHLQSLQEIFPEEGFASIVRFRTGSDLWDMIRRSTPDRGKAIELYEKTAFCPDPVILTEYVLTLSSSIEEESTWDMIHDLPAMARLNTKISNPEQDCTCMTWFILHIIDAFRSRYNNLETEQDIRDAFRCLNRLRNTADSAEDWNAFDFPPTICQYLYTADFDIFFHIFAYMANQPIEHIVDLVQGLYSEEVEITRRNMQRYKEEAQLRSFCRAYALKEKSAEEKAAASVLEFAHYPLAYYLKNGIPGLQAFEALAAEATLLPRQNQQLGVLMASEICSNCGLPMSSALKTELFEKMETSTDVHALISLLCEKKLNEKELEALLYLLESPELRELRKLSFRF